MLRSRGTGRNGRVRTGHRKPGKSWSLSITFSRPGKSRNVIVHPLSHGKLKFISISMADDKMRTL